jgi:hypothetical protein
MDSEAVMLAIRTHLAAAFVDRHWSIRDDKIVYSGAEKCIKSFATAKQAIKFWDKTRADAQDLWRTWQETRATVAQTVRLLQDRADGHSFELRKAVVKLADDAKVNKIIEVKDDEKVHEEHAEYDVYNDDIDDIEVIEVIDLAEEGIRAVTGAADMVEGRRIATLLNKSSVDDDDVKMVQFIMDFFLRNLRVPGLVFLLRDPEDNKDMCDHRRKLASLFWRMVALSVAARKVLLKVGTDADNMAFDVCLSKDGPIKVRKACGVIDHACREFARISTVVTLDAICKDLDPIVYKAYLDFTERGVRPGDMDLASKKTDEDEVPYDVLSDCDDSEVDVNDEYVEDGFVVAKSTVRARDAKLVGELHQRLEDLAREGGLTPPDMRDIEALVLHGKGDWGHGIQWWHRELLNMVPELDDDLPLSLL